jgi:outer membrane protein
MSHRAVRAALGVLAALVLLSLAAGPLWADINFGYIDSSRLFAQYKAAQEAQARFDRQVQGWRDEADEKKRQVDLLRAEVRDQSPILSSLKRQEKDDALQKAISDYERFVQDIWGPQGRAASENETATSAVVQQIRAAVEKVAGEKALNLVLDAADGNIIYADKKFDITDEVLAELNKAQGGTAQ